MLKTILLCVSMSMSIGIYGPWLKRVIKRQHTRDFSKVSAVFVTLVQVNGFFLATAESAHFLQAWYLMQIALTGTQLFLIHKFWNADEPRLRGGK